MTVNEQAFKAFEKATEKVIKVLIDNEEFEYRGRLTKSLEVLRNNKSDLEAVNIILYICSHPRGLRDICFKGISYEDWDELLDNVSSSARAFNSEGSLIGDIKSW